MCESENPVVIQSGMGGGSLYGFDVHMCVCVYETKHFCNQISTMQLTVQHICTAVAPLCECVCMCACVCVCVYQVVWGLIMLSESIRNNRVLLNADTR